MTPAAVTTNLLRASAQSFTPTTTSPSQPASGRAADPARSKRTRKPRAAPAAAAGSPPAAKQEAKPARKRQPKASTGPTNPTPIPAPAATAEAAPAKAKAPVAAPAPTTATATTTTTNEDDGEDECCLVCAEPFTYHAIGECNHAGICSLCSMRMRLLMKDKQCPICKQTNDRVIVTKVVAPYASFGIWGETGGPGVTLDEKAEMFFSQCDDHHAELIALRTLQCRHCHAKVFKTPEEFAAHMHSAHKLSFCELCLSHQHFFAHEQPLYTKGQLKAHNSQINRQHSTQKFREYHPNCEFCLRRFYSDVELHTHLEQDHFKCHLCNAGHRYYRNYIGLESHFRKQHHLCEHPTCLGNRFVVFGDELEYQNHVFGLHGDDTRFLAHDGDDDDDDALINPTAVTTEGATRLEFLRRTDVVVSDDDDDDKTVDATPSHA
ncbi:hypothetical protein SPRG_21606 [Saprolegnia parasitica CBS 223.65]|uniref:RING-type domain-containing protein n=1 Tax=Saprolegnia parasitica (strain CBS 223.65) TaxID=695850 RepID=A0A067BLI0_SAPPC|nr:hypothetical protein SPRG_21606 [Saprolegnia parasitica CBS 223.65]KDO19068.1 hypothetical protein SPRG_21606 [Saprolegnia parasitica CBS 223.65]|eukprot:XP_012210224.1 hypothetical protein SPRG_21606 [Saprolegnia parasitica CBS 223.65]